MCTPNEFENCPLFGNSYALRSLFGKTNLDQLKEHAQIEIVPYQLSPPSSQRPLPKHSVFSPKKGISLLSDKFDSLLLSLDQMRKAQIRTHSIVAAIIDRLSSPDLLFANLISPSLDTLDN
jgi:hypothetical protein